MTRIRLHVGQGTHRGSLTVFPVWTDAAPVTGLLTGAAAQVDVVERAGSPSVDQLVVTNRTEKPVLLLAGELLEGGWQNRTLTASTVLAPATPTVLPVLCVEHGRWGGGEAHRRQARRAPVALRPDLEHPDAQARVWRRVSGYTAVAGPSPTDSLLDRLDRTRPEAERLTAGLTPLAGQSGVLLGIAGRPVSLELFGSRRSLTEHWMPLLEAAALDALGRPAVRTTAALARAFAERVQGTDLTAVRGAGAGRRYSGGGRVRVDDVRWRDRTVHLNALDLTHPVLEAS
ncbi:hypothetical protein F1C76_02090 [Geodermatophilaceae bacterium NBWT11]|nr:hypothetical protein F1C76_02090 [Geodermatophilaceae bacterium NBWT11]